MASFQGFFLSFLGPRFLRELYAGILADPSGIAFVFVSAESVTGFVAGSDHLADFYRRLLRGRLFRFFLASIRPVLRRPRIIGRLFRAIQMPSKANVEATCGTLMSIAVAPNAQHMGIGKQLVRAFLEEAAHRNCTQVNLTTDRLENDAVNRFYQELGFSLAGWATTPEGREMNEYRIRIPVPDASRIFDSCIS